MVEDMGHDGGGGKVLWHVTMSVDGFIAGPDDEMDWALPGREEPSAAAAEVVRTTGAILAGRRWYDVAVREYGGRAGIYGGAWSGPVFVLTHRVPEDPQDPAIRFLDGDLRDAVTVALAAAEGRNVVLLGADLAGQCAEAGLADEIIIHLVPVLLGGGVRLFSRPGGRRIALQRLSAGQSGQVTDLRFRPAELA